MADQDIEQRAEALRTEIAEHNRRYHELDDPTSATPSTTSWSASCGPSRRSTRS